MHTRLHSICFKNKKYRTVEGLYSGSALCAAVLEARSKRHPKGLHINKFKRPICGFVLQDGKCYWTHTLKQGKYTLFSTGVACMKTIRWHGATGPGTPCRLVWLNTTQVRGNITLASKKELLYTAGWLLILHCAARLFDVSFRQTFEDSTLNIYRWNKLFLIQCTPQLSLQYHPGLRRARFRENATTVLTQHALC